MPEHTIPPARHEGEDMTFGFMLAAAGSVLCLVLLCTLLVMWLYPSAVQDHRLPSALPAYPAPQLQANPHADLLRFETAETKQLDSTGWVDKAKGIVHIPIDEAMRRIAQQGIADWPQPAAKPADAKPADAKPADAKP